MWNKLLNLCFPLSSHNTHVVIEQSRKPYFKKQKCHVYAYRLLCKIIMPYVHTYVFGLKCSEVVCIKYLQLLAFLFSSSMLETWTTYLHAAFFFALCPFLLCDNFRKICKNCQYFTISFRPFSLKISLQ